MNNSLSTRISALDKLDVLLVDDELIFLKLTKKFLEQIDKRICVHFASSAPQALDFLNQTRFDVIVSDYQMPEMNGLTFLETIRREGKIEPFIVFTGRGREEVAIRALNLGANRYLQKGGDPQTQYKVLAQAICDEVEHYRDRIAKYVSEEKFSKVFKSASSLLAISTIKEGLFIDVNDSFLNTLGYSRDEVIGKTSSDLNIFVEFEDRRKALDILEKEGNIRNIEVKVRTKNGKILYGSFSAIIIHLQDKGYLLTTMTDITKHKETEERESFLLTLLSHDLRNKIQVIHGYLDLLTESTPSEDQTKLIKRIDNTIEGCNRLINKVGILGVIDQESMIEIDLDQYLKNAIDKNLNAAEEKNIRIDFEENSFRVIGGTLLEELFHNLIENSIRHAECKLIKITSQRKNEKILIRIEDDGIGIPIEIRTNPNEKVKKKNFTFGEGLGIFLIKNIVKSYDGEINYCNSELGGARVEILLNGL